MNKRAWGRFVARTPHGEYVRSLLNTAVVIIAVSALFGCYSSAPQRIALLGKDVDCNSTDPKIVNLCNQAIREKTPDYDLFFVEFTDQGWPHRKEPKDIYGDAAQQLDYLSQELRQLSTGSDGTYEGISIVLFAHGWKHNAEWADQNIQDFRKTLKGVADVERAKAGPDRKPRRVVGIYLGWRGRSLLFPDPVLNITFWERKTAALDVSVGSARELFARLRVLRDAAKRLPNDEYAVRFLIVGHSFGGLIVYSALSAGLIADLVSVQELLQHREAPAPREGDMIIVLNPAFEASRYEALHRLAEKTKLPSYEAPLFAAITSQADLATRYLFPIGRMFNTFFENEETEEELVADLNTPGHIDRYITHRLTTLSRFKDAQKRGEYANVQIPDNLCADGDIRSEKDPRTRLTLERENAKRFFCATGSCTEPTFKPGWVRFFCGGTVLIHVGTNPHSLIWNIQTDGSVIDGHSDITKPHFVRFVRQLYNDSALIPRRFRSKDVPTSVLTSR